MSFLMSPRKPDSSPLLPPSFPIPFSSLFENSISIDSERSVSPLWESQGDSQSAGDLIRDAASDGDFTFKHNLLLNGTMERRRSQRKQTTLEKFLRDAKESARLTQYDDLPFHHISSSRRYQGILTFPKDPDDSVGYLENEFEVVERVGFGDFAEVFKVRWRRDKCIYAVKRSIQRFPSCFHAEEHPEEQLRWMDEAFYHNAISGHPNVVQCIQSWEEAGYFYIHMDYLPMRLDRIAEKFYPIPENVLWNVFVDLLMAIDHLKKSGFCHLDIKPENIFQDEFGITKLGDFSLITMAQADNKVAGDARYMPAEAVDPTKLDFRVDVFSVGITMLELCSDVKLETHGDQWWMIRDTRWPATIEERMPPRMRNILKQMMNKDARLRPSAGSLLRLSPLRYYAMMRKAHFLMIPVLRLQAAAVSLLKNSTQRVYHFLKQWTPQALLADPRPVTPVRDQTMLDHSLRYDFSATPRAGRPGSSRLSIRPLELCVEESGKCSENSVISEEEDEDFLCKSFLESCADESEVEDLELSSISLLNRSLDWSESYQRLTEDFSDTRNMDHQHLDISLEVPIVSPNEYKLRVDDLNEVHSLSSSEDSDAE